MKALSIKTKRILLALSSLLLTGLTAAQHQEHMAPDQQGVAEDNSVVRIVEPSHGMGVNVPQSEPSGAAADMRELDVEPSPAAVPPARASQGDATAQSGGLEKQLADLQAQVDALTARVQELESRDSRP